MISYSPFFSSGLAPSHDILAAYPRPRPRMDSTSSTLSMLSTVSVSTIRSPISGETVDDTSDPEDNEFTMKDDTRETTPTPQAPQTVTSQPTRWLRRRKSSLSTNTSPITVVRSPSKAAENALSFQMRVARSRNGSVSTLTTAGPTAIPRENSASMETTLTSVGGTRVSGRSRSGSVGTMLKPSRRGLRRPPNNPLPPPSAPLPPVPPFGPVVSVPVHKRSRSISLVPRLLGLSVNREPLPPLPPTPPSYDPNI